MTVGGPAVPRAGASLSGWAALRREPTRAPDLAVLHALPLLSPSVERWSSTLPVPLTDDERARLATATVRRSTGLSRRSGIIVGSSFYVGMVPALTATYLEQILVALRVAAIHGRDPAHPARAAEILHLQGRYPTIEQAQAALGAATGVSPPSDERPSRGRALEEAIRQLPSMLGLQLLRWATPVEVILNVLKVAALLIPVISIPLWVYVNGRSAQRIGTSAMRYYARARPETVPPDLTMPAPPSRRRVVTALIATELIVGALAALVPLGWYAHRLPLGGVVLAEVGLALAMLRLLLVTRPGMPPRLEEESSPGR